MNILITGATGYLASQITRLLISQGHQVTCCVRNVKLSQLMFPQAKHLKCDFYQDTSIATWQRRLQGIDIVINAVGIFHHPQKKCMWLVHYQTPKALFDAANKIGVKKIIQISANGIQNANLEYAKSKLAADEYLQTLSTPSVIVRPSLIYGEGSYGGSSLLRGLAGFPCVVPVPGKGNSRLQPIQVKDLANAIARLANLEDDTKQLLVATGPQQISIKDFLLSLRLWLLLPNVKTLNVPLPFIYLISQFGDLFPYSITNTTAYTLLLQNNIATNEETQAFTKSIGFKPKNVMDGLFSETSTVQDRWHARLYFLSPLLRLSLAFMWLMSAFTSAFIYPKASSYQLLADIGINYNLQPVFLYGACLINAFIGLSLLFKFAVRKIAYLQLFIIFIYTVIISIQLPYLWIEPFGAIVKNIPILVAILILLALEDNR